MENNSNPIEKLRQLKANLDASKSQPQENPRQNRQNPAYKYFNPADQPKPSQIPLVKPEAASPAPQLAQQVKKPAPDKSFFENIKDGFNAGLPSMLGNMAQGVAEFTDMIPSIAATAPAMGIPTPTTGFDKFAPAYKAELAKQAKGESKPALPSFREFAKGKYAKADAINAQADPESWGYMIGSLAPQGAGIAAAVGVGALNPAAGMALGIANTGALGTMAAGSAAKEYDDYVAEKGIAVNPNDKLGSMMLSMAAESVSEAIPVAKFVPKGFRGQMSKFIFGNTETASKKGAALLQEFANTNASRGQMVKNVLREAGEGALTEGPTEAVAELGGEFSSWLYKEKEDRATWKEMAERAAKAVVGGSIMGAAIGPMSYGAQQVQNQRRRKESGKVVMAQDKNTGEAIEIMGVANPSKKEDGTTTGPAIYQAIRPNGKIYEVDENNVGTILELPLEDFNGILSGKGKARQDQQLQKASEATQQQQSASDQARAQFEPLTYQGPDGTPMISGAKYNGEDVFITQVFPDGTAVIQKPGADKQVVKQDGLTEMDTRPFEDFISTFAPPPAQTAPAVPLEPVQIGESITNGGTQYVVTGFDEESGIVQLENQEDGSDLPALPIDQFNQLREQSKAEAPLLAGEDPTQQAEQPLEESPAEQLRKIFSPGDTVNLGGTEQTQTEQPTNEPATGAIDLQSPSLPAQPTSPEQAGLGQPAIENAPAQPVGEGVDSQVQVELKEVSNKDSLSKIGSRKFDEATNLEHTKEFTGKDGKRYYVAKTINKDEFRVFDAELIDSGGQLNPIGTANYDTTNNEFFTGFSSNDSIQVNPESRRKGIATAITKFAEQFYKKPYKRSNVLSGDMKAFVDNYSKTNQPTTPANEAQQLEQTGQGGQENVQEVKNQENSTEETKGQEGVLPGEGVTPGQRIQKEDPKKKPRKKTPEQIKKQEVIDREPSTATGYARKWLLTGGKLNSTQSAENKDKGVGIGKGVRDETGMSGREMRSLIGIIDNKNGLSPEVAAERIHETLSEQVAGRIGVQDLRNALIDIILSEDRKKWVDNQDAETREQGVDAYLEWAKSQLSEEEIADIEAEMQKDSYFESLLEKKDELAKEYDEFINSAEYQDYIEEIYGQFTESNEDGRNQPDPEEVAGKEPKTGTDGNRIDAGRERQDPDSNDTGSQGKSQSEPAKGTGNDSGNSFLNTKGDFANELRAAKASGLSKNDIASIEAKGTVLNSIRQNFPQLTDLHENEIYAALKSGIKPETLAKLIFGKVNDFSFNQNSPLNFSNQKATKPVTKKSEIEKQIDSIKKRVAELRKQPGNKPEAKEEIAVLTKEVNRLIQQLDQAMGKEQAAQPAQQEDLFAAPKQEQKPEPKPKPKTAKELNEVISGKKGKEPRKIKVVNGMAKPVDGKAINPGDTFITSSGRETTSYPKYSTKRTTATDNRNASEWLIENAIKEAQSRKDNFNEFQFKNTSILKNGNLTTADTEAMSYYLFDNEFNDLGSPKPQPTPSKSDQLSSEAQKKADELKNLFGDFFDAGKDKLQSGPINAEQIVIAGKIIGKASELGIVRFKQLIEWANQNIGTDKMKQYFDAFKAAFGANLMINNPEQENINEIAASKFEDYVNSPEETQPSNESNRPADSKPDREISDAVQADQKPVPGGRADVGNDGKGDSKPGSQAEQPQDREGSFGISTPVSGKSGNQPVQQQLGIFGTKPADAGIVDGRGDSLVGTAGTNAGQRGDVPVDKGTADRIESFADSFKRKIKLQAEAEKIPAKLLDKENIRETLPVLLDEQQEDVIRAEERFFGEQHKKPELANGKGYLFTNGTGTGKTFTGLGVAKRFIKQGKVNILLVVPGQPKVADWKDAAEKLGITINPLANTKDAGKGFVATTYANFNLNQALKDRDWDLIIYDESHLLMAEQKGNESSRTVSHYKHSAVSEFWALEKLKEATGLWEKERELRDQVRRIIVSMNNPDRMDITLTEMRAEYQKLEAEADKLVDQQNKILPSLKERAKKNHENTKVLFLSASPFATVKNLAYANGTLFDWGNETTYEQASRVKSRVDPKSRFLLDNFGSAFEWKNHQLQERSNASAEAISMQEIAFGNKLAQQGVMSGRAIESNRDYARHFPLVTGFNRDLFNDAVNEIYKQKGKFPRLSPFASKQFFEYENALQLMESMRTSMSLSRIDEHLKLGRKVVIFHKRHKADVSAPFANVVREAKLTAQAGLANPQISAEEKKKLAEMLNQAEAFEQDFAELLKYEQTLDYSSTVEQITKKYGDQALYFNGNVSTKDKIDAIKQFNDDDSKVKIIVVHEQSGREGISLHDTTGKNQRALMSMSLPSQSITTLQVEGRIYRIGQESDAVLEYPILGLDTEIAHFASKINKKVSTTENLAMGDGSRDLLKSFAFGVMNASDEAPSMEQGKGGKELDKREREEHSQFKKARLVYAGNQKVRGTRKDRQGVDFYPTPEPVGQKMVEWLGLTPTQKFLEPSAGKGAIAMWAPGSVKTTAIEPAMDLIGRLGSVIQNGETLQMDFMDHNIINKYDGVAMNPPFGQAGSDAIKHLEKATKHLRNGGRVVALIPVGATDKKFDAFMESKDASDLYLRAEILLPSVTFEKAGTAVNTRIVVIDKVNKPANEADLNIPSRTIDLRGAKTVDELFDRLENISMPDKIELQVKEQEQAETPFVNPLAALTQDRGAVLPEAKTDEGILKYKEGKHTQTGEVLHLVEMTSRVDNYDQLSKLAKYFKGFYDRYSKSFRFKNKESADAFIRNASNDPDSDIRFMKPTTAADLNKIFDSGKAQEMIEAPKGPKQTTKAGEIAKKAAEFTKGWNNAPEIITLNSTQEARERFPELANNYTEEALNDVPAIFIKDPQTGKSVAVLIASHSYLSEKGGVERAILHEVIGHYGIREFLKQQAKGDKAVYVKAFTDLMEQVFEAKQDAALMADIAKRYFNKPVSELQGQEKLIAADEYIAHLAQSGVQDAWIDRVVAKLRNLLRKLGITVGMSDAEIRALIGNSMRVVRGQNGMPVVRQGVDQSNVPQFMVQESQATDQTQTPEFKAWFGDSKVVDESGKPLVVYHGTEQDFTVFEQKGTKWAAKVGFWFTQDKGFAENYGENIVEAFLSVQNPKVIPFSQFDSWRMKNSNNEKFWTDKKTEWISQGHDGLKIEGKPEVFAGVEIPANNFFVAFQPTQIKSATSNSGEFNPENADIRFMRTGASNADFSAVNTKNYGNAQLSWFERKFIEPLQDRMIRSKKLIQARTGGNVSDKADFYTKENLASGKTLEKARRFEKDLWNPLIQTANQLFNANQISPEEISNYLKFKHHAERKQYFLDEYAKLGKKVPKDDKWPTGMTDQEAADGIADFEAKADPKLVKKLRRQVHKVNQFTTFERYKSGMITKEVFRDLLTRYKDYVPLTDWKGMEDTNDKVYTLLMSAKGRTSEAADPLPFMFTAAQESIMRGENNRVRRSVLEFVKENVSPSNYFIRSAYYLNTKSQDEFGNDIWIETMNKPSDAQIQAGEAMRSFNPEVHRNVQQQSEMTNILPVMVSGKKVFIEFKDKEIPSTIKNINQDKLPYILDKWRNFTRWLSSMYTQYSPEFGIRNLIRDVGFGTFNILVEHDVTTAAKTIKGMGKSGAALGKFFKNNDYPKGKVGDMLKEFMEEGAMTGYSDLQTAADVFARAKKEIERADKLNLWQAGGRAVAAPLKVAGEYLEVYNKMLENAMRFSYYQTLREAGLTKQKAAAKAKDLTVNFNRKGRASSVMGSLFIFFNASVQGSERLIRSFTNPRTRRKALGLGGTIMAAGLMQSLLYGLSDEEDEDGRTFYEKIPDYTRRNNIILPNFFTEDGNDFLKIPLPYGLNVFHSFGESLGQVLTGKKTIGQESLGMLSAMTNVFSPIGGIELGKDDSDGFYDALSMVLPSVIQPALDLGFNRNFAGRQIYRENFASNQYQLPDSQMYFEGVNPIIREATDFANKLTGGNEVVPGAVDINPEWVEHGINQYLGGPAQFTQNLSNTVINLSKGENIVKDPFLRSTPFVRSYVDKTGTDYQARSEYYENRDNAVRAAEAYDEMLQAGLKEDADEWYKENEDLIILADEFKTYEKDIKSLTKTINELKKEDKELFNDDINKLIEDRTLYMREFNKLYGQRIYKKRSNPIKDLIRGN